MTSNCCLRLHLEVLELNGGRFASTPTKTIERVCISPASVVSLLFRNVFIMGCVTFSLGCYMVCCSVASLAVGYIYLSCSHLYSFASHDRPYALKIKYPVIRGFFYT